jgi:hypothetical protein
MVALSIQNNSPTEGRSHPTLPGAARALGGADARGDDLER